MLSWLSIAFKSLIISSLLPPPYDHKHKKMRDIKPTKEQCACETQGVSDFSFVHYLIQFLDIHLNTYPPFVEYRIARRGYGTG